MASGLRAALLDEEPWATGAEGRRDAVIAGLLFMGGMRRSEVRCRRRGRRADRVLVTVGRSKRIWRARPKDVRFVEGRLRLRPPDPDPYRPWRAQPARLPADAAEQPATAQIGQPRRPPPLAWTPAAARPAPADPAHRGRERPRVQRPLPAGRPPEVCALLAADPRPRLQPRPLHHGEGRPRHRLTGGSSTSAIGVSSRRTSGPRSPPSSTASPASPPPAIGVTARLSASDGQRFAMPQKVLQASGEDLRAGTENRRDHQRAPDQPFPGAPAVKRARRPSENRSVGGSR